MIVKLKSKAGFTVAELIIVSAIFILMAGVMVANFRRGEKASQFLLTAEEVASHLREMQTQSLTGQIEGEIVASGGFGAYFDLTQNKQYILFRDDGSNSFEPGTDVILETVDLPAEISLADLSKKPLAVVFSPPKPTVFVNGQISGESVAIYLSSDKITDKQGYITLNPLSGRITAELINP